LAAATVGLPAAEPVPDCTERKADRDYRGEHLKDNEQGGVLPHISLPQATTGQLLQSREVQREQLLGRQIS